MSHIKQNTQHKRLMGSTSRKRYDMHSKRYVSAGSEKSLLYLAREMERGGQQETQAG